MPTRPQPCEHRRDGHPCAVCRRRDDLTAHRTRGAAIRAIRDAFADPDARRPRGADGRLITDAEWCIRLITTGGTHP